MTDGAFVSRHSSYSRAELIAGILIASTLLLLLGIQPVLVGLHAEHFHLTLRESGWVLAAEQIGAAGGALVGYWLAPRARWSHIIIVGSAVAVAANVGTTLAGDIGALALLRLGSGAATMMGYTVAIYFLGTTSAPDRSFGIVMVLQTSLMAIGAVVLSRLAATHGYSTALVTGGLWFLAPAVAAIWLPRSDRTVISDVARNSHVQGLNQLAGAGLAGSFLLHVSIFSVWGYLERVGRRIGFSDTAIGDAIGIGVLGGIVGGLLPVFIGARFGRVSMIAVATALLLVSYVALSRDLSWALYVVSIATLNVGWVLGLIYYMGLTACHDSDGRFTRLLPFVQVFGAGVGPVCSALVTGDEQLQRIVYVASIAAVAGLAIVFAAASKARRPVG